MDQPGVLEALSKLFTADELESNVHCRVSLECALQKCVTAASRSMAESARGDRLVHRHPRDGEAVRQGNVDAFERLEPVREVEGKAGHRRHERESLGIPHAAPPLRIPRESSGPGHDASSPSGRTSRALEPAPSSGRGGAHLRRRPHFRCRACLVCSSRRRRRSPRPPPARNRCRPRAAWDQPLRCSARRSRPAARRTLAESAPQPTPSSARRRQLDRRVLRLEGPARLVPPREPKCPRARARVA